MAFNVDTWRSAVKDSLPATHYELNVNPPVGGGEELTIRTETASMPGIAFMSVDNFSPYGNGLTYNIPYRYNPQEVSMTHTIDENAAVYQTFRDWCNEIVDLDGSGKFGAKFLSPGGGGYSVDMTLTVYNRKDGPVKTIKFIEAFPLTAEPVSLGWGNHDEIAKMNVSYRFTRFEVS